MPKLTKSLFMNGEQCTKLLWYAQRKELPEITLSDKHKFAQGRDFEKYVKKLFPDGVDLSELKNEDNIKETQKLVDKKKTIFEAGFQFQDLFVKNDILEPTKEGWHLYEIKASSEVKPEHIPDLAFQKYVCEKVGLKINKCFVLFLNKEYAKNGEINPQDLVSKEEVTDKVNEIDYLEEHSKKSLEVFQNKKSPEVPIGKHCNKPHECPLKQMYWAYLPEYNVIQLTNWRQYWKFFEDGILGIKDIPKGTKLTDKDQIITEACDENKTVVAKEKIKEFLASLHYPLYHLDFETFDTAVPLFDKSKPYQKIPFQYSIHIQQKDGTVTHFEFLSEGGADPRPLLLKNLMGHIVKAGQTGNIIVFNKSFEMSVLTKLAEDFPEHKGWITDVVKRIVDLAEPFKNFDYYNPKQKGQYSIKKVLPSLTGTSYSELEINNGGDASAQFFYSNIEPELKNAAEIRKNLLKFCSLDTEGMEWIVNEL